MWVTKWRVLCIWAWTDAQYLIEEHSRVILSYQSAVTPHAVNIFSIKSIL
jgi:hypothetical protein